MHPRKKGKICFKNKLNLKLHHCHNLFHLTCVSLRTTEFHLFHFIHSLLCVKEIKKKIMEGFAYLSSIVIITCFKFPCWKRDATYDPMLTTLFTSISHQMMVKKVKYNKIATKVQSKYNKNRLSKTYLKTTNYIDWDPTEGSSWLAGTSCQSFLLSLILVHQPLLSPHNSRVESLHSMISRDLPTLPSNKGRFSAENTVCNFCLNNVVQASCSCLSASWEVSF